MGGHVECMGEKINGQRVLAGKCNGYRQLESPRRR
jgi:hypothetical protein